nr:MAG: wsv267-like protein [Metapenaeopsis lamellata majanivirus]
MHIERLAESVKCFNSIILQVHILGGSTDLLKLTSMYRALEVYKKIKDIPPLSYYDPFSGLIIIKIENNDILEFFHSFHSKDFKTNLLMKRKINYSSNMYFDEILHKFELWFDCIIWKNCPYCSKGPNISTMQADMSFMFSFPITVQGNLPQESRIIDFRFINIAGSCNGSFISFPLLSGPALKWTSNNGSFNDNNNSNSKARICCLIHYIWLKELSMDTYKPKDHFVKLFLLNKSKMNNDITNTQYIKTKQSYNKINFGYSDDQIVYPQELKSNIKVILLF